MVRERFQDEASPRRAIQAPIERAMTTGIGWRERCADGLLRSRACRRSRRGARDGSPGIGHTGRCWRERPFEGIAHGPARVTGDDHGRYGSAGGDRRGCARARPRSDRRPGSGPRRMNAGASHAAQGCWPADIRGNGVPGCVDAVRSAGGGNAG